MRACAWRKRSSGTFALPAVFKHRLQEPQHHAPFLIACLAVLAVAKLLPAYSGAGSFDKPVQVCPGLGLVRPGWSGGPQASFG